MPQPDDQKDVSTRSWKPARSPLPESFSPDRQSLAGGSSKLADETRDLLHRRLHAASLMLAVGFGAFLLHDLYFLKALPQQVYLHCLVFFLLVLNVLALSGRWKPSMRQLRVLELATFGVIAGYFIAQPVHRNSNTRPA